MDSPLTPTEFAAKVGISVPYACQIIGKTRTPSRKLAIQIFQRVGMKFAPIAHLSDKDIRALARIEELAA